MFLIFFTLVDKLGPILPWWQGGKRGEGRAGVGEEGSGGDGWGGGGVKRRGSAINYYFLPSTRQGFISVKCFLLASRG